MPTGEDALPGFEGEVVLDGRDDGETLRRLARLRALLLARSGLEPEAIDRISAAIRAIWSGVDAWARRAGLDRVATLAYALSPENLVLTVHDEAGWLSSGGDRDGDARSSMLTDAGFDQVETDHEAHCLRLVKRFSDPLITSCKFAGGEHASSWVPFRATKHSGDRAAVKASLSDSDRALLLATAAWGDRCGQTEKATDPHERTPSLLAGLRDRLAPAWFQDA